MSSNASIKVLYIVGCGRSGSTIIDIVLGNHKNIESVGELISLPKLGWIDNGYCSCGLRANECDFWSSVRREWERLSGLKNVNDYVDQKNKLDRLWRRFEEFKAPDIFSTEFKLFAKNTYYLYKAIQTISGKSVVVDSSKNPLTAYLLSFITDIDLRIIHLVRDPRGVTWSQKKSLSKDERSGIKKSINSIPMWHSALNWRRINLRSEWVCNQCSSDKTLQISYEDFMASPRDALMKIGQLISEDFEEVIAIIESNSSLILGHNIAGNRVRMSNELKLKFDDEWNKKLSIFENALVVMMSGYFINKFKGKNVNNE